MAKNTVIVEIKSTIDPGFGNESDLVVALMKAIRASEDQTLTGISVEDVHILGPGQGYVYNSSGFTGKTEEIVDELAAAGEVTTAETIVPLLGKRQLGWAKQAINCRLRRPVEKVVEATISKCTNTLYAWCLIDTHDWQWITVSLPPESVDLILG